MTQIVKALEQYGKFSRDYPGVTSKRVGDEEMKNIVQITLSKEDAYILEDILKNFVVSELDSLDKDEVDCINTVLDQLKQE